MSNASDELIDQLGGSLQPQPRIVAQTTTSSSDSRAAYYPAFDYLRISLALAVVIGHAGLSPWQASGNFSVQVFFALSGWLIGGILLKTEASELPKFYFHRSARIWIPYLVAIALLMMASLIKEKVTTKWIEIFFYDVTFVYNFFGPPQLAQFGNTMPLQGTGNHFWSICAEEQFYLLAPLLITILGLGRKFWLWVVVGAAAMASPYWDYFGSITLGVASAVAVNNFGNWHTHVLARRLLGLAALVAFAATISEVIPYRIAAPLSAICIVLYFAQTGQPSRGAILLGGMSFPLYLNHWIGVFAANLIFGWFGARDSIACKLSAVPIALLFALLMYHCVDLVIKRHRDAFYSRRVGIMLATCGFTLVAAGLIGGTFFFGE